MEVTPEHRAIFAEEARENLEEWEGSLLSLEQNPGQTELIHKMFRAIHTLKGSAGFIAFHKLQMLTHELESSLQDVRDGSAELSPEMIEGLFAGLDLSRRMVESFCAGREFEEEIESFLAGLKGRGNSPVRKSAGSRQSNTAENVAARSPAGKLFELKLIIKSSGREAYLRSLLIRNKLSVVGKIVSENPQPEALRDSTGSPAYSIVLDTDRSEGALRGVLNIDQLEISSVRELVVAAGTPETKEPDRKTSDSTASGDAIVRGGKADEVVRVSVEKMDTLLNLVGELVIQNSGFISIAQQLRSRYGKNGLIAGLEEKTEALAGIIRNLQDGIMRARMLPVGSVFSRFHRVVRDLVKSRKKEIVLDIAGEETEIDKKVMDRIGDPLVHLVRNAVDHGIESREQRLAAGKGPVGHVRLAAFQNGDRVCIEVCDDGRGLDREAVLRKAVEKGIVGREEAGKLSDEQILDLVFLPGVSTASEVSEVSGRGVGMDVVKRTIEEMGGSVRLRCTAGRGTTVTISLPLTMAIIPAVMVEVDESTLAVPLSAVNKVLKVSEGDLGSVGGRRVIRYREEILSMVHLREALSLDSNGSGSQTEEDQVSVIVVDYETKKIGLGVDRVLGTGEIVIKSLNRHYREIDGLIGASIMGNGRIALIVDVEALVRQYYRAGDGEGSAGGNRSSALRGRCLAREPGEGSDPPLQELESESTELSSWLLASRVAKLEEIHNAGAIQASIAVSRLIGMEIRVSFPEYNMVALSEVADILGGEEAAVAGIYVGISGELRGGVLLVIPEGNLRKLRDLLFRHCPGGRGTAGDVDISGIAELANILSASFINAISDGAGLPVRNEAPEISIDMCVSVVDGVLARFNQPGERILLTTAMIFGRDMEQVVCHLLMLLEPDSMRKLLDKLLNGNS